jgi:hypothetical protein
VAQARFGPRIPRHQHHLADQEGNAEDRGLGTASIIVEADTPLCVLREPGRFVNYAAGSAQATVRRCAGRQPDQAGRARKHWHERDRDARNISSQISIDPNLSLGASVCQVLRVARLPENHAGVRRREHDSGTYIAFDIVATSAADALTFRTFAQQRGVDHRFPGAEPVLISPELGNLGEVTVLQDYRDEITYVLAAARATAAHG